MNQIAGDKKCAVNIEQVVVEVDHNRAQPDIACGRLETHRHIVQKLTDDQLFLYSDYALVRPGHPDVGDVRGSAGKYAFISSGNVGMRANDCGDATIQIPAKCDLL